MRQIPLAVLTVLTLSQAARAAEPDPAELKAIAKHTEPARDAWERCMAAYAKERIAARKLAAADIADKALAACTSRERRVRDVLAKHIGADRAGNVIDGLREMHKANLAGVIEQLRRKREAQ
jgi:hypothetical protein